MFHLTHRSIPNQVQQVAKLAWMANKVLTKNTASARLGLSYVHCMVVANGGKGLSTNILLRATDLTT